MEYTASLNAKFLINICLNTTPWVVVNKTHNGSLINTNIFYKPFHDQLSKLDENQ